MPHRLLAVGSLVIASLAAGGCGSPEAVRILNTEKVERAIERSTFDQRKLRVHVSCPSGVHQQKGLAFACTAVGTRGDTRFVVTQRDDAGHVHYEAP